jgi:hypothetical protein
MEIIWLVEGSDLPVRVILRQMSIARSTFYGWYARYLDDGFEGVDRGIGDLRGVPHHTAK